MLISKHPIDWATCLVTLALEVIIMIYLNTTVFVSLLNTYGHFEAVTAGVRNWSQPWVAHEARPICHYATGIRQEWFTEAEQEGKGCGVKLES